MSIGERISEALKLSGKTQADLARHLSTKPSTLTGWVKNGNIPSAAVIVPICEFTGVSIYYLLGKTDNPIPNENDLLPIDSDEHALLEKLRSLPPEKRQTVETLLNQL